MAKTEAMSVDEMVRNLVAAGGEACEDSLSEAVVAYSKAHRPERDEVRSYPHVGVTFMLVSPPKGWCRFHGKPAESGFIIVRSDDEFASVVVVWFASMAHAHFEGEAWIG